MIKKKIRKIVKIIKYPPRLLMYLDKKGIIRLNDKMYLKILYKIILNKKLDLNNPKTFNEKLQWLKIYDRNPEYTKMVDKYDVKKYVSDLIGKQYIIPTIGIFNNFDEINFDELPNRFVIKSTNDSGGTFICNDKTKINWNDVKIKINQSLKKNYYYNCREWPYKNIKPRIIIEENIQ